MAFDYPIGKGTDNETVLRVTARLDSESSCPMRPLWMRLAEADDIENGVLHSAVLTRRQLR